MPALAVGDEIKPPRSTSPAPPLSLRRNFSWTFAGNVLYAGSQWGFLILLAKLLEPAAVGEFAFALAVTAPIIIFANQGLTGLQATDAKCEFSFAQYFTCRALTTSAAFLVIVSVTLLFHWSLVVVVVAAAKSAEAICDIRYGQYQRIDRMDRTAVSMMLRGTFSLLIAAVLLVAWRSVIAASLGIVIANVAVLVAKDYRAHLNALRHDPHAAFSRLKQIAKKKSELRLLLWQAFPLGLAAMLSSATSSIPRYFVEHYAGTAMLGIFAALTYLLVAGRTLIVALAQACVARLSRLYIQGLRLAFARLVAYQMALGLILGGLGILVSIVAGKLVLTLLYRPEYARYARVLVIVMIAAALNYLAEFSNGGLLAVRSIRVQPAILAVCCVAILILSALLVPRFGIVGAAWAVAITGAIQLSASLYFLMRARFSPAQ